MDASVSEELRDIGFPDSKEKLDQCLLIGIQNPSNKMYTVVLDDLHLVHNPSVLHFLEEIIRNRVQSRRMILICRNLPPIDIAGLEIRGLLTWIREEDLNFTESEMSQYLCQQGVSVDPQDLYEIMQDTSGWAFAAGYIARTLKKSLGYSNYARNAIMKNLLVFMESEMFGGASERLCHFWVRLSLVDHLPMELVNLLGEGDEGLLEEFRQQSAYVNYDAYIDTYRIHPLFKTFLQTKRGILSAEEERATYECAADWSRRHSFFINALNYYEKLGNYEAIVSVFFDIPLQIPLDIARCAAGMFERAPAEAFDKLEPFAALHVRAVICQGLLQEATQLEKHYEGRFRKLPKESDFRNRAMGLLYYAKGVIRILMGTADDCYDFDKYFTRMDDCLTKAPIDLGRLKDFHISPWITLVGTAREGALEEYIEALGRSIPHVFHCLDGTMAGLDDAARGEALFYRGRDMRSAETFLMQARQRASASKQFGIIHCTLLLQMRIVISQGDFTKAEHILKDIESQLEEQEYTSRFITYDIALGWYFIALRQPQNVPGWLKNGFVPYGHPVFLENFGNQVKAHYCYLTEDYASLLAYMERLEQCTITLYARAEMLAMKACVYYKMKDFPAAVETLREAYEASAPNDLLMPFMEFGKDMRALAAAVRRRETGIPSQWLETIERRSSTYAKYHSLFISGYQQANDIDKGETLTPREFDVLRGLYHGLSRPEIASEYNLSINTVKLIINRVYSKLKAQNLADLIRIATERKLV